MTPKKVKQICQLAQNFDIVFIDRSVFGIIAKKLKEDHFAGRVIVFFHNVEALYFDAKISKHIPFRNVIIKSADHNDAYSCRFADKVIALNRRDDDKLFERYQRHADILIPIVFRDRFKPEHQSEAFTKAKPECLFIGSYFAPNNEGLLWFVRNVLPHVEINFIVVGKGMEKIKEEEPIMHDVEVIGSVPDLTPYINEADIMILPIFKGSGMKVKTCESLMFGKNILGTDEAFEGYDADYDRIGGKCNTADDFIGKINDFITSPRPRFNTYSRQLYLERYSESTLSEKMRKVLFD